MSSSLLNHRVISERYFFPRTSQLTDPTWVDCGDAKLGCWHQPAQPGQKTIIHFHGNGEVVGDYIPEYAQAVADLGVGIFLAEYRGYGASTGRAELGHMLTDVQHIAQSLALPPDKLIVYGRSVGAIFAVEFASRHPGIAGLILESGVADVLQRLSLRMRPEELGVSPAEMEAVVNEHLNLANQLSQYHGRLLVLHARDDDLVTPDHAESNFASAATTNKELVYFERGGHNGLMAYNFPRYLQELNRFVAACR